MRVLAFDSGVGGLSAVAPLLAAGGVDLTYFGDLANLPYGTKSPRRICELVQRNLNWLLEQNAQKGEAPYDLLIVACNTASAHAMAVAAAAAARYGLPALGVLEPNCRVALQSQAGRIVVLATSGTVNSGAYTQKLRELSAQMPIVEKACPLFVPLVEDRMYDGPAVDWIIQNYLGSVLQPGDSVILGCTHYPFLLPALRKNFSTVNFIDAGHSLLKEIKRKHLGFTRLRMIFSDQTVDRARLQELLARLELPGIDFELNFDGPAR